jgi:hypothetical protein
MAEMTPMHGNKSRGGTIGWKQEQGVQQARVVLNLYEYLVLFL